MSADPAREVLVEVMSRLDTAQDALAPIVWVGHVAVARVGMPVRGRAVTTPDTEVPLRVQEIDQWYAMVAALPCIRAQPDLMATGTFTPRRSTTPDDRELVRLAYRRVRRGSRVVVRDVRAVREMPGAPWFSECILTAVEGLTFRDPRRATALEHGTEGHQHELAFSSALLGEFARELRANE